MLEFLRNLMSVIAGFVIGSAINMGLIILGPQIIPPPNGVDITTEAGLKATMHLFEAKHYLFPFLAHALGTLFGAYISLILAKKGNPVVAFIIAGLFLGGGIVNVVNLPSPLWFSIVDLVFAYLPMAFIALMIFKKLKKY